MADKSLSDLFPEENSSNKIYQNIIKFSERISKIAFDRAKSYSNLLDRNFEKEVETNCRYKPITDDIEIGQ